MTDRMTWPATQAKVEPFAPSLFLGLQGAGKTTTTGKLAKLIESEYGKKCCLVAADIYRPAAADQLRVLGERLNMPVYHRAGASPVEICDEATAFARENGCDVVLLDTAGRLAIDEPLMQEILGCCMLLVEF